MNNLRSKLTWLASKKVPALSLVLVAIAGMVAGVLAATMVITQYNNTGVGGSYRTSTGDFTVTDTGIAVVANGASADLTTAVFGANGTNVARNNLLTAGNWMEVVEFTTTLTNGSTGHTATIVVRNGSGPIGTILSTTSVSLTAPSAVSTGKVTVYVDLGGDTLTSPLTVYVSVT